MTEKWKMAVDYGRERSLLTSKKLLTLFPMTYYLISYMPLVYQDQSMNGL